MPRDSLISFENNKNLTIEDILRLHGECLEQIRRDELYYVRNEAKLRAVNSVKNYDEFKDIVDAAHLQPLSKFDKMNGKTKTHLWNNAARNDGNSFH